MSLHITKSAIDLGIVTTNGDPMLAFYRDTLGLSYAGHNPMPGGNGTMHRMMCGDTMIKLVVLPETKAQAAPGGIGGATGYRYWTITVGNLSEALTACEAAGARIVVKEREIAPGVRIGIVADPDGNWVELLGLSAG
ncbi:VOC family protein [Hydrogenophaga sp. 5NK40-0174]|uniref:VOC family protein n=1 Tax=Hydrogenophaga sp. 5NK40-0174 TaxID=3127649 RepID=UPI0031052774